MYGNFDIIDVAGEGLKLLRQEWRYFAQLMILPVLVHLGCSTALYLMSDTISPWGGFLVTLPAYVFMAWYLFAGVRLTAYGERMDRISSAGKDQRRNNMRAAVILILLFNMGLTVVTVIARYFTKNMESGDEGYYFIPALFILVLIIWGLRLGVLYIPAALGYPVQQFLSRVHGFTFSWYLLGLILLVTAPLGIIFLAVLNLLAMTVESGIEDMPLSTAVMFLAANSVFSYVLLTVINITGTYAIKDIIERKG